MKMFLFRILSLIPGALIAQHNTHSGNETVVASGCAKETTLQQGQITQAFDLTQGPNQTGMARLFNEYNLENGFAASLILNLGKDGSGDGVTFFIARDTPVILCNGVGQTDSFLIKTPKYLALKIETGFQQPDRLHLMLKNHNVVQLDRTATALENGGNIETETFHTLTILWNKGDRAVVIMFDDQRRFCERINFDAFLGATTKYYIGIIGSAGADGDVQTVGIRGNQPTNSCCQVDTSCSNTLNLTENFYPLGHPGLEWWQISPNNINAVTQQLDKGPAFFGLPRDLLNMEYRFRVTTPALVRGDIGFYIGQPPNCSKPEQFNLRVFRWRGATDNLCNGAYVGGGTGYLLAHVNGVIPPGCDSGESSQYFWGNTPDSQFSIKHAVPAAGWMPKDTYNFRVLYLYDVLEVYINDTLVAQEKGDFQPGRFGFYTMNQAGVEFSKFSYQHKVRLQVIDTSECLGGAIDLRMINRPNNGLNTGEVSSIQWKFGDGTQTDVLKGAVRAFKTNHIYKQSGIYNLKMTATNSTGCMGSVTQTIVVHARPQAIDIDTIAASCVKGGSALIFSDSTNYSYSLDGKDFIKKNIYENLPPGLHKLVIRNTLGCKRDTFFNIAAPESISVQISPPDDSVLIGTEAHIKIRVFPDGRIPSTRWQGDTAFLNCTRCDSPLFSTRQPGIYRFTATVSDTLGCSASANIEIVVREIRHIYAPNAFTPNGDGINDYFTIYGGDDIERINLLRIYDRWGELVHEARDFLPGDVASAWKGYKMKTGDLCHKDVYVYYSEYTSISGKRGLLSGDVNLF
jgi:gliding motility-associated-like protein